MNKVVALLVVLFLLYLLSTRGRRGHPEMKKLRGWSYAHRGLHGPGRPENSMAAFRAALNGGYGAELDVHLLADGNLAVIHDSALKRATGADGNVEELTTQQLKKYHLRGTDETIPEFRQVLELFAGRAPLIVELKAVGRNYAQLCRKVCEILDGYKGAYCLESFDPRCVYWLKKNRPDVIRGQLTENYFKTNSSLNPILKFLLTHQMLNFLTTPDFVAYRYADSGNFSNWIVSKFWRIQGVAWTLHSKAEYDAAVEGGLIPVFENFTP